MLVWDTCKLIERISAVQKFGYVIVVKNLSIMNQTVRFGSEFKKYSKTINGVSPSGFKVVHDLYVADGAIWS